MNKCVFTLFFGLLSMLVNAQIVANDSVTTGPGNENMVFYSLTDGSKTTSSNTDWHVAVTVRPTQFPYSPLGGTSIRINEGNGVHVFVAPPVAGITDSLFTALDTTGWQNWRSLHDSTTNVDEGALNERNKADIFDFGWGEYNSSTHNVDGDSVYLFQLPNGDLKKFIVTSLVFDTAFDIKYSNIDNSSTTLLHIGKGEYTGKEFVYINLQDDSIRDKEPLANLWDLQFLNYAATDVQANAAVRVPGAWINKGTATTAGVTVAKADHTDPASIHYTGRTFSFKLDAIGWNWKQKNGSDYIIQDSLVYFVQATSGLYYKVIFTGYSDATGEFDFYKQALPFSTGINEISENNMRVYPNPADQVLNISLNTTAESDWKVCDITGKVVASNTVANKVAIVNTGGLPSGMYLLSVTSAGNTSTSKFIVAH